MPPILPYRLFNEDCFEAMERIPAGSVDMVLADLPYGTTQCKWDTVLPLDRLWAAYKRVCKPNAAIVLNCQEPFTSVLIVSNIEKFRYKWIWEKTVPTGHLNANRMPMKWYEELAVFYLSLPTYNPQLRQGKGYKVKLSDVHSKNYGTQRNVGVSTNDGTQYKPKDIIQFANENGGGKLHPTQKPVGLAEYMVKTYTDPGELILDNCMGSGTTGIACMNLGRRFIGCDNDKEHGYFEIATKRIREAYENAQNH